MQPDSTTLLLMNNAVINQMNPNMNSIATAQWEYMCIFSNNLYYYPNSAEGGRISKDIIEYVDEQWPNTTEVPPWLVEPLGRH